MRKYFKSLVVAGSSGLLLACSNMVDVQENFYSIVENENGFYVVDNEENNDTILCKVEDVKYYGFEKVGNEIICKNLFDDLDFVIMSNTDGKYKNDDLIELVINDNNEELKSDFMNKDKKIKINY